MKFILISTLICLSLIPVFPSYALHGEDYHCMNEGDCPLESYLQISIVPIVIIIIIVVIIKKKNKDTSSQSPFQTKDDEQKGSDRRIRHHSEYAKKYSLDEMRKKFDKEITSEREKIDAKWKEKFDKEFSSNKKMSPDELEKNKIDACYIALELEPSATPIQIRNQYRKLIKFYHPDNFQKTPEKLEHSEKKTKEITYAYEHLKNAGKLN